MINDKIGLSLSINGETQTKGPYRSKNLARDAGEFLKRFNRIDSFRVITSDRFDLRT